MKDDVLSNGDKVWELLLDKIGGVQSSVDDIDTKVDALSNRMSRTEGKIRCGEHATELRDLNARLSDADTIGKVAVAKIGAMAAIIAAVIAALHEPIQKAISTIGGP